MLHARVIMLRCARVWALLCCLLVASGAVHARLQAKAPAEGGLTSLVIVGATGDLARKYLWCSAASVWAAARERGEQMIVIGAARSPARVGAAVVTELVHACAASHESHEVGKTQVGQLTTDVVSYARHRATQAGQHVQPSSDDDAQADASIHAFMAHVVYAPVRNAEAGYAAIDAFIKSWSAATGVSEAGRAFYLAITPRAFVASASIISRIARPPKPGKRRPDTQQAPWFRVVFEKPFGRDAASAAELAKQVGEWLEREEVLVVDHYLGKGSVQAIASLRAGNVAAQSRLGLAWSENVHAWRQQGRIVSTHTDSTTWGLARIEVAMAEAVDVAGRTAFYDDYGVVRDVLQNHVSQMLALALADPSDGAGVDKVGTLQSLRPDAEDGVRLAQYRAYGDHVSRDAGKHRCTRTATGASVRMQVTGGKWKGVQVSLLSAKDVGRRSTFVRLVFQRLPSVPSSQPDAPHARLCDCERADTCDSAMHAQEEVDVWISVNGHPHGTSILVAEPLATGLVPPTGWDMAPASTSAPRHRLLRPQHRDEAYTALFTAATASNATAASQLFVDLPTVGALWDLWHPVVAALQDDDPDAARGADGGCTLRGEHLDLARYSTGDLDWAHCEWAWLDNDAPPTHQEL